MGADRSLCTLALTATLLASVTLGACQGGANGSGGDGAMGGGLDGGTEDGGANALPEPFQAFYNVLSIAVDGDEIVIRTKDLPDHKSPFYAQSSPLYEAYNGSNPQFSTAINLM